MICPECEQDTLVCISVMNNIKFYSCNNEKCIDFAEVVLDMGNVDAPSYVKYHELVKALNNMDMSDIQNEPLMLQ